MKKFILANDALFRLEQYTQKYPKRITRINDKDLKDALQLYQENITNAEQDQPQDIRRWIRECSNQKNLADRLLLSRPKFEALHNPTVILQELSTSGSNEDENSTIIRKHARALRRLSSNPLSYEMYVRNKIQRLEDYFWVHKKDGKIVGIVYYQYYYEYKYAFVGYLVSKDTSSTYELLARSILSQLHKQHPECLAVIGEMDHPRFSGVDDQGKALARLDLLCRGWGIPLVGGVSYIQPKLALVGDSKETPLIMLYYPLKKMKRDTITGIRFGRILDFLFDALYGDAFETQQENREYRQYLSEVKQRIISQSTYPARLERLGPNRSDLVRWLEWDAKFRGF